MPRKRATRAQTGRAKPKLKDEGDNTDDGLSAQQREEKLAGYLADCDIFVNKFRSSYERALDMAESSIDKTFTQIRVRHSQSQRQMTFMAYLLSLKEISQQPCDTSETDNRPILSLIQPAAEPIKSAVSHTLSKYRPKRDIEPIAEEDSSETDTVRRSKRGPKTARNVTFNPAKTQAAQSSYITPAQSRSASALGWNTPLVTPKFDPRLPITPAQYRNAMPGEIAISMSGSPLNLTSKTKPSLSINRKGKTLQIQMPEEYDDILDNLEIPDNIDLENNSDDNIKKMMNMFAMMIRKGEDDQ